METNLTTARRLPRCGRNMAGREEDCGPYVAYEPCGKPAEWTISPDTDREWVACEEHCIEALLDGCDAQGPCGHPARVDDDGELYEAQP